VHFDSSELTAVCPVTVALAQQVSGGIVTTVTVAGAPFELGLLNHSRWLESSVARRADWFHVRSVTGRSTVICPAGDHGSSRSATMRQGTGGVHE
jgi:hypothetical protein